MVLHPETSEHWVVFSHQENRGLRLCGTSDLLRSDHVQIDADVGAEALFDCSEPSLCLKLGSWWGGGASLTCVALLFPKAVSCTW